MIFQVMAVSANSYTVVPPEDSCICIQVQKRAEREYKKMIRANNGNVETPKPVVSKAEPLGVPAFLRKWLLNRKHISVHAREKFSHADIGNIKRGKCFRW